MTGVEDIAVTTAHDLSMIGLFSQATWVVKSIIILLIACSFWSWTIIFAKLTLLGKLKRMANKFEDAFWNSGSIDIFFDNLSTLYDNKNFTYCVLRRPEHIFLLFQAWCSGHLEEPEKKSDLSAGYLRNLQSSADSSA